MKTRRIGNFKISPELFDKNKWEGLLPIMGNFVVVRAEFIYATNEINYTAFSPLFDECDEGVIPPDYEIEIANFENGPAVIKAHKANRK